MQAEKHPSNEIVYFQQVAQGKVTRATTFFRPLAPAKFLSIYELGWQAGIYPGGMRSTPIYGRRASGTRIEPSACW